MTQTVNADTVRRDEHDEQMVIEFGNVGGRKPAGALMPTDRPAEYVHVDLAV